MDILRKPIFGSLFQEIPGECYLGDSILSRVERYILKLDSAYLRDSPPHTPDILFFIIRYQVAGLA